MTENKQFKIINDCGDYHLLDGDEQLGYDLCSYSMRKTNWNNVVDKLNEQDERIRELETDVEYWKQVASQYSNELNVFEHCKKYKTECKDIYWDSD